MIAYYFMNSSQEFQASGPINEANSNVIYKLSYK